MQVSYWQNISAFVIPTKFVIPAKAGIYDLVIILDSRFRGNDSYESVHLS